MERKKGVCVRGERERWGLRMEKEGGRKKGLRRKKREEEGEEQGRGKKRNWEQKDCAELKNE